MWAIETPKSVHVMVLLEQLICIQDSLDSFTLKGLESEVP